MDYTCGKCGKQVYVTEEEAEDTFVGFGAIALYCKNCDDIICIECGMKKKSGSAIPCGKCGGYARGIDSSHHPSWYPGKRKSAPNGSFIVSNKPWWKFW